MSLFLYFKVWLFHSKYSSKILDWVSQNTGRDKSIDFGTNFVLEKHVCKTFRRKNFAFESVPQQLQMNTFKLLVHSNCVFDFKLAPPPYKNSGYAIEHRVFK